MLLLVTDAEPYMKKATKGFSASHPELIHVAHTAHALHRVCETIRKFYSNVDKLVANKKNIFVKLHCRIRVFKNKVPDTPLPPAPVITCWGTWLDAIVNCKENF
jgi:hypothetical protein